MFRSKWWTGMALLVVILGSSITMSSGCKIIEDRQREREKEREWEREQAQMRNQRPGNPCCPNPCCPQPGGAYPQSGFAPPQTGYGQCGCP
jgi:hypothetical protein